MIVCLIVLAILLLLLFWPLRFDAFLHYDQDGLRGRVSLRPLFTLPKPVYVIYDSDVKKIRHGKDKPAKQRKNKDANIEPETRPKREIVLDFLNDALTLLADAKCGVKRLRLRGTLAFAFGDPALNGEVCGALYAALPWLVGDTRHLRWRLRVEPQWCYDGLLLMLKGRLTINLFDLLIAFGLLLPQILRLIKKIRRINHERTTSNRVPDAKCA